MKKYLLIKDYADKKRVSERTVYNMIARKEVKTKKIGSLTLVEYEKN